MKTKPISPQPSRGIFFAMKKSFLMYADGYDTLKYLSDEQLGKLTRMMFEYFLTGKCCEPSDPMFFIFNPIKMQMDRDVDKYSKVLEVRREAGKKGGEAKASKSYQMLPNAKVSLANVADKDTVTVTVKDTDKVKGIDRVILSTDSIESNPVTIQPDSIQLYTHPLEKKKVAQKKKDHRFADSIYADDPDLFIEHWNQTETARTYPDTDPLKVYTTLKTSSDASSKYTYANWISAAQNWVKRNPAEYKRTYTTAAGHQLHHNDQAILDRVERLTRNTFGG